MAGFNTNEWNWLPSLPKLGEAVTPTDDATAQLLLKRRMAQADALRQQQMPQGQMVSGHYVAPSWTQYLGNLAGKYVSGEQEREALKGYQDFQTSRRAKVADLLAGKEVEQPVDLPSVVPGQTQTVRQPYSKAEFMSKAAEVMPELQDELLKARIAQLNKVDVPVSLAAGGVLVNPSTGQVIASNPKDATEQSMFGKINPAEYTPESVRKFMNSKDYGDLVFNAAAKQAGQTPYFQALPTAQGYAKFNARTGQIESLPLQGQPVLPAAQSPQLQGQIAGAKFEGEAGAKRAFNMAGAPDIVNEARSILTGKIKPTGSGAGTIADIAGAAVGYSPRGAAEADQLRAISGQLVAKMPRMEGPQSDRDVQLYTQMAGQIGDSTIPVARRLQALKTVEGIITKYAPQQNAPARTQPGKVVDFGSLK